MACVSNEERLELLYYCECLARYDAEQEILRLKRALAEEKKNTLLAAIRAKYNICDTDLIDLGTGVVRSSKT